MSGEDSEVRKVVRYSRDRGAVCFEFPLLRSAGKPRIAPVNELLSSQLKWLWISEARSPSPDLPADAPPRMLTRVTESNVSELVSDLSEEDVDGYGRFVALFGIHTLPDDLDPRWLHEELKRLATGQEGNLQLVVVQIGDTPNDYVFVPRYPSHEVARMLNEWGISAASPFQEEDYAVLRLATLENMFGLNSTP